MAEFVPGLWNCQAMLHEKVFAVDEALRAVVIGQADNIAVEILKFKQGGGPTVRIVFGRVAPKMAREIGQSTTAMSAGNPIGVDEDNVPIAAITLSESVLKQRMEVKRHGLKLQPGMFLLFEQRPLSRDCRFKRPESSDRDFELRLPHVQRIASEANACGFLYFTVCRCSQ